MADVLRITVLEDGTIRTEADEISPANHQSAEAFLRDMARLTGGETQRARRGDLKVHDHVHQGQEQHGHAHE